MLDKQIFVTFNVIDRTNRASLFDYPIIYWWNTVDTIEDMFNSNEFISKLMTKLSKEIFFNLDIMMSYVYENENGDFVPVNKTIKLHEIIEFPKKYEDDLIVDVLKYLYKCSFKTEPQTDDIKELFDKVKSKYPNKVTSEVVMRYIQSSINESYPNIPDKEIEKLSKKFLHITL